MFMVRKEYGHFNVSQDYISQDYISVETDPGQIKVFICLYISI